MRYDLRRGLRAPVLLLAALTVLTAACQGNTSDSSQSGSGPETPNLTIGVLPIVDVAPVYLAEKEGYFKQEGLTVKFQQAQGGAALIPAMVGGNIQIAFSNYVSLFLAKNRGIDLNVIAEGVRAKPGFSGVFTMPGSPIKTPADLADKKVAVNTLNNVGDVAISAVLTDKGVDPKTLKFVEIPLPDMGPTMQRGEIDAAWVVEPFTTSLKTTLNARAVIDPFTGPTDGMAIAGYATLKRFADQNPKTIAAFRRALSKATAEANTAPSKVAEVVPTYTGIKADAASKFTLPQYTATADVKTLQRVADLMQQFGRLNQRLEVASFTRSG